SGGSGRISNHSAGGAIHQFLVFPDTNRVPMSFPSAMPYRSSIRL
ncbi:Tyr recombinase domain-containing protein, partial [Dysosmobacter welbionis]